MIVYYVRHAESESNFLGLLNGCVDTDLTSNGKNQALRLKEKMKDKQFDLIFSSPLKRAYDTAKIVFPNEHIEISELIKERNFNNLEGMKLSDIDIDVLEQQAESKLQLFRRLLKFIKILKAEYEKNKNANIIIFTHSSIIRHLEVLMKSASEITEKISNADFVVYEFNGDWVKIS